MTNAEKIKNMDSEELADILYGIGDCCRNWPCKTCYLGRCEDKYGCTPYGIGQWLESEAEE